MVPKANTREVVELALDKASREDSSRSELLGGAYLRDVFRRHGVL